MNGGEFRDLVIVGGGQAAAELVTRLRQYGYAGSILLIGEEGHLPYQRPPLSKGFLSGKLGEQSLWLRPAAAYAAAAVELRLGERVVRIDREARRVFLDGGGSLGYGRLVLATGGGARRLVLDGAQPPSGNVHYVRTIDDVARLRPQFVAGARLVVVGGGYIGLEIGAVAVGHGLQVDVLEAAPRVLARVAGAETAAFFERRHRAAGVRIHPEARLLGWDTNADGTAVTALRWQQHGRPMTTPADCVVVGIGLEPRVELAAAAGLALDNGIAVGGGAVSSDPAVLAIGDCAAMDSPVFGGRLRLESVPNAIEQARAAAATIAGRNEPYAAIPWFWSEQYDLKLQSAGLARGHDAVVVRGDAGGSDRTFAAFYLAGRRLLAADVVGRPAEFAAARRLIAARAEVDPAALADPRTPLAAIAAAAAST